MKKGELIAELEKQLAKSNDDEGPVMEFCLDLAHQLEEPRVVDNGKLIDILHEEFGVCGHCGKRDCAGRKDHSVLRGNVPIEKVLGIINGLVAEIEEEK